jgi:hypothetical protein
VMQSMFNVGLSMERIDKEDHPKYRGMSKWREEHGQRIISWKRVCQYRKKWNSIVRLRSGSYRHLCYASNPESLRLRPYPKGRSSMRGLTRMYNDAQSQ